MEYMTKDNEIYSSIVKEFGLSSSTLVQMEKSVQALNRSRTDICNLLGLKMFNLQTVVCNEKELMRGIDINKSNIVNSQKKQEELKGKNVVNKQEVKVIKQLINKLDNKLNGEKLESRKLNEELRIFMCREKFKLIKKLLIKKYKEIFMKYSNELSIKNEIMECSKKKEKIREEKQNLESVIERTNKRIITNKSMSAQMRKNIVIMQKSVDFSIIIIAKLEEYKEIEKRFRLEADVYEGLKKIK